MSEPVLVQKIDEVEVTGMIPGLHKVRAKGTHNTGASNPRLLPMYSGSAETLKLGLYVDPNGLPVITPVEAEIDFWAGGFRKVCVAGEEEDPICRGIPQ